MIADAGFRIEESGIMHPVSGYYIVPERKLGFLVKIKEDESFNHRNTVSISRINF